MFVSNAHKRTQRSKSKDDSPATAGVGKMPAQTVTNKKELRELGERMGWKVRPLTEKEIRGEMSGQELIWHETFSPDEVEKALALTEKNKEYDATLEQGRALRLWHNVINLSSDEQTAFRAEFQKFVDTYPQFRGAHAEENTEVLTTWLQDRHLTPIYANLCLAFEANALAGKLWLNPSAIAAGAETEVIGTQHHNFHLLIQPQRRNTDDGLSADAYLAQHDELKDMRTPPLIAAREARASATADHFAQAAANTARSGSMTVTEYPDDQSGYPAAPTKYSFRCLLDSLSATEFNKRLNEDPAFATAVDRLNDGNK